MIHHKVTITHFFRFNATKIYSLQLCSSSIFSFSLKLLSTMWPTVTSMSLRKAVGEITPRRWRIKINTVYLKENTLHECFMKFSEEGSRVGGLFWLVAWALCLVPQSCATLHNPMDCSLPGSSSMGGDSPCKNTGVGCHALVQGIFPTQGLNPGIPHCRRILYCLSHHGSPRILEWVAHPFSRGSSWPRNGTGVSCMAGRFFTSWATWEAHKKSHETVKHQEDEELR